MSNSDPIFSYKNSRGKFYALDFRLRNHRIRQRGFYSEKEARLVMESIRTAILLGSYDPFQKKMNREGIKLSLSDLFERFIIQANIRESTKGQCISTFKVHFQNQMGSVKIKDLNVRRINRLLEKLTDKYAGHTVKTIFSLIKNLLIFAYKEQYIPELIEPELPRIKPPKKKTFITMPELEEILEWLYSKEDELYPNMPQAIHVLGMTGIRIGELLGLRPSDIDFDRKTISIKRTIVQQMVHKPKNDKILDIPIHPQLELVLRNLVSKCLENGAVYLFENSTNKKPYTPKPIRKVLNKAAKEVLGIDSGVTPHTLRRSLSQFLLESGFSVSQISAMLRNSNQVVLRHYSQSSFKTLSEQFPKLVLFEGMKGNIKQK